MEIITINLPIDVLFKNLLTIKEAMQKLGVSKQTLYTFIKQGKLRKCKKGWNSFILAADVDTLRIERTK